MKNQKENWDRSAKEERWTQSLKVLSSFKKKKFNGKVMVTGLWSKQMVAELNREVKKDPKKRKTSEASAGSIQKEEISKGEQNHEEVLPDFLAKYAEVSNQKELKRLCRVIEPSFFKRISSFSKTTHEESPRREPSLNSGEKEPSQESNSLLVSKKESKEENSVVLKQKEPEKAVEEAENEEEFQIGKRAHFVREKFGKPEGEGKKAKGSSSKNKKMIEDVLDGSRSGLSKTQTTFAKINNQPRLSGLSQNYQKESIEVGTPHFKEKLKRKSGQNSLSVQKNELKKPAIEQEPEQLYSMNESQEYEAIHGTHNLIPGDYPHCFKAESNELHLSKTIPIRKYADFSLKQGSSFTRITTKESRRLDSLQEDQDEIPKGRKASLDAKNWRNEKNFPVSSPFFRPQKAKAKEANRNFYSGNSKTNSKETKTIECFAPLHSNSQKKLKIILENPSSSLEDHQEMNDSAFLIQPSIQQETQNAFSIQSSKEFRLRSHKSRNYSKDNDGGVSLQRIVWNRQDSVLEEEEERQNISAGVQRPQMSHNGLLRFENSIFAKNGAHSIEFQETERNKIEKSPSKSPKSQKRLLRIPKSSIFTSLDKIEMTDGQLGGAYGQPLGSFNDLNGENRTKSWSLDKEKRENEKIKRNFRQKTLQIIEKTNEELKKESPKSPTRPKGNK